MTSKPKESIIVDGNFCGWGAGEGGGGRGRTGMAVALVLGLMTKIPLMLFALRTVKERTNI